MPSIVESSRAIKIFFCYTHADEALRDELEKQLKTLQQQGLIVTLHDRKISAGMDLAHNINIYLNTAQIILLLVSPDFMDSEHCYIEMKRALERHEAREARVIPVILRPVFWDDAPFNKLKALPRDGIPVTSWLNRDEAFLEVAKGVRKVVNEFLASYKVEEGKTLFELKRYSEALKAFQQAVDLDPNNTDAYNGKGSILSKLNRYESAINAFDLAIHLDPGNATAYRNKGNTLRLLEVYSEALAAYDQAIRLDPNNALAYSGKGDALSELKRYNRALAAYKKAIRLDPNNALAYSGKGNALSELKRYNEALAAYDQAIRLDPNNATIYGKKGLTLELIGKLQEAMQAYKKAHLLYSSK